MFRGREARLNRAILLTLTGKIAQTIWDITKQMTKTRGFKNTRYHNVNTRVKALENLALIRKVVHELIVSAKISKKLPNSWMYSVRTHSLRKYFRTQMSAAKVDTEIIQYMMGHTVDTYEDVQSLGIETLRNLYTSASLRIRPKTQANRIEQLKEIIRAWGENPEEILTKNALMRGNITETQEQHENHQLSLLAEQLKQLVEESQDKHPKKQ